MATRSSFIQSLIDAYKAKRSEIYYAAVKSTDEANEKRVNEYISTPEWLAFEALAKKLLGDQKAESIINIHNYRGYGGDGLRETIGLQAYPDHYVNNRLDTLTVGALTTTRVKFWDGLCPPVIDFLDAVEKSATNEDIDEAIMDLVLAL